MSKLLIILFSLLTVLKSYGKPLTFPNACDVVSTRQFDKEMNLQVNYSWCPSPWPLPPWPCAHISYNLPKYFIEVVHHPGETMFGSLPFAKWQITPYRSPFGFSAVDDNGAYSYQAHAINVPLSQMAFSGLPCGGGVPDLMCFSAASEHLGSNWLTGIADKTQAQYLAWAPRPKACLAKGSAVGITGQWGMSGGGIEFTCSHPFAAWLPSYPPTDAPVCTAWGIHFPRTGIVTSSDTTTAALMVASRIKSIGADVFRSVNSNLTDKWQMIYPHSTSSFKEGQSIPWLRGIGVNEASRLSGKLDKFLFVVWQESRCTVDAARASITHIWKSAIKAACKGNL
ncbi:MAG: hypothetical protein AB8G05_27270 [Oligoflexales bacterium]